MRFTRICLIGGENWKMKASRSRLPLLLSHIRFPLTLLEVASMSQRKRYVLAGTGGRGLHMFGRPILEKFRRHCELVGLFDINPLRMQAGNEILGVDLPMYTSFPKMLRELDPDAVIVATRDVDHAKYIIQTLDAGKRAISEKPLCVDAKQCRQILEAARRNRRKGADCYVTHNMRYGPPKTEMKRLLDKGVIGELKAINFHENLNRRHGADYFRRWHRIKALSGGLLIHKASHHFDYLNWLVGSKPDNLVAMGGLQFYGKNGPFRHKRCRGCPHARKCDFHADLFKGAEAKRLYQDAEKADGYLRDGCVFDRKVDIEDQATVAYDYRNGVQVTYSLTAYASYEGMQIFLEGTKGRIEYKSIQSAGWAAGNITIHGLEEVAGEEFMLFSPTQGFKHLKYKKRAGSHGGADPQLRHEFFGRPFDAPLTKWQAPVEEAVQAVLIGHAANVSIAKGSKPVKVQDFLKRG